MKLTRIVLAAAIAAACGSALAADPITQRQDVFKDYKKTFGPMGDMVKGKTPYDKAEFAKLAAHLEVISKQPWQYFTPGTDKGKTGAKAEIWSKSAEWKQEISKHEAATAALAKVAATGDLAAIKPAFGKVGQTCKSCHDAFRKPD
ncbi:c-type cytochrome [Crenobacter caeni]|uniref:Cytochrome c n=1 Tax=Crenobacter caeni TaxID=2705474 RepID=A0A6B2KQR7_9NEIS|nr:cytochrome c [Crenobacter caeni]NDV12582.1 cytochrome c [Crenobacter caeni]